MNIYNIVCGFIFVHMYIFMCVCELTCFLEENVVKKPTKNYAFATDVL